MGKLYIDEKGPQERFKISEPFDTNGKLAYGTDIMPSYIANAWYINDEIDRFNEEFKRLEDNYLSTSQNKETELKGSTILKGKVKYGVSSMSQKGIEFYINLFDLLIRYESKNLIYSVNKMSIILDSRLLEWIYIVDKKRFTPNPYILKYTLTKYLSNEASKEVIKSLLNLDCSSKDILNNIQRDMQKIIDNNKKNIRMTGQLREYKLIIRLIKKAKHLIVKKPQEISFDWSKVTYGLDLWLSENDFNHQIKSKEIDLYLDKGIKKEYFEKFEFRIIYEDVNSKDECGIRVSDLLVAISGNLIKSLRSDSQYDRNTPDKVIRLSNEWFEVNEQQFYLLKIMNKFLLSEGTYSFVVDTFFDDEALFQSYLNYFAKFNSLENYLSIPTEEHIQRQFNLTASYMKERWQEGEQLSASIRKANTSFKELIEVGLLRPL